MAIKTDTFQGAGAAGAVTSVNTQTGAVVLSANDLAADHSATNYTAANANVDGHLSGIDTKLGTIAAGLTYQGTFNATTGAPSIANALQGDLYIIGTAGTIYGQTWAVGDHLLINEDMGGSVTNSKIDKIDNTDQVTSVNGDTGAVTVNLQSVTDQSGVTTGTVQAGILKSPTVRVGTGATFYELPSADGSSNQVLATDGAGSLFFKNESTAAAASETVAGVIEIATNAEAAAATATDKALVPSNISSLDLSDMDNTTAGFISSVASASETVQGIIEIATNAEAAAGTATDKALVPSNISSLDLSAMDNSTAGFIANINSESLNDLSDVDYTAGAGIDNYVLTYDHSTTSWGAEAAASGGLSEVIQDLTPQLGGNLDVNGNSITSASNGNVTINPDGTGDISIGADIIPDADATHTIGDEDNRFISYYGDVNGAIRFKAKNDSGAQITKGQVVYIKGISGTVPTVDLADADVASKMPAFGLAFATANDQAELQVVSFGNLTDVNTSTFTAGDTLYVSTTAGGLTATKPTGESALLQNIGRVLRSDATAGIIKVGGAGRSAATPNLNQDKIFLGNASNQAVSTALSSIALSSFNDDLSYLSDVSEDSTPQLGGPLDVAGQDIISASNGDIEIAPDGTGSTILKGNATGGSGHIKFNCEQNSHAVTIKGPAHSATATYTLTLPTSDGNADQVLKTDGSGVLSWVDQPAGASPASETVAGVIEIATNAEAAAGTATDKALVPSNIASLDLSAMDNTTAGFIAAIVTDTSPQLGGPIDVNGNAITSASNGLVEITPNGTGAVKLGGNTNPAELRFFDEAGTNYVALKAPLDSAISADETFTLPATDGTNGQVLTTNGSGVLSFTTISGGGGSAPDVTLASPSANYTISTHTNNEEVYVLTPSANIEVILPAASACGEGYKYQIKNMSASYSLTINPNSTETVDGQSTIIIGSQYESLTLVTDSSNWFVI